MGGTSPLDLMTRRFESGILRLVLWGIPGVCRPSPPLLMDGTSSLDQVIARLESEMLVLVLRLENLLRGIRRLCCPLPTLPMGIASFSDLVARLFMYGSHPHVNHPPLVIQYLLIYWHGLIQRAGSEIQTAGYSVGYP